MDVYYNHYYNLFKRNNDLDSLKELEMLHEYDSSFNFDLFRPGVFTCKNVNIYGYDFLIRNITILTDSLLTLDKERVLFVVSNPALKNLKTDLLKEMSILELKKINVLMENLDYQDTLSVLSSLNTQVFKDLITDIKILNRFHFLMTSFEYVANHCNASRVLEVIYDPDFDKFMQIVDKSYIKTDMNIATFIERYQKNKKLIDSDPTIFNSYFFNYNLTLNNLDNYYEDRYNDVLKYIRTHDIENSLDYISRTYFNSSYSKVSNILSNMLKMKEKGIYLPFFRTSLLLNCKTKEDLVKFVTEIKEYSNISVLIKDYSKKICIEDLVTTINSKLIKTNNKVHVLEGEDFIFLLHKVKGYSNRDLANKLREDPSYWDKVKDPNAYISTSLVWEDYFSLVEGNGYILGFYPTMSEIIAMGPKDIYVSRKQVRNNLNNSKAEFLLVDELKDKSLYVCNEVALKRSEKDKVRKPDFVFVFDEISEIDMRVSNYFNIPIYLLKSDVYAARMQQKLYGLLSQGDIDTYINRLLKMYLSFSSNRKMINEYFNVGTIEATLDYIGERFGQSAYEKVLEAYDTIISIRNYIEEDDIKLQKK